MKSYSDVTDECFVAGKVVYVLARRGYSRTLYNNSFIEEILKVDATTRNINTLREIAEIGLGLEQWMDPGKAIRVLKSGRERMTIIDQPVEMPGFRFQGHQSGEVLV